MVETNILVEEFTKLIPSRRLPLAETADVRSALDKVDAVLADYYEPRTGEPLVSVDWLDDLAWEFGSWLAARLPMMNAMRLFRQFPDSRTIQEYARVDAVEQMLSIRSEMEQTGTPIGTHALTMDLCDLVTGTNQYILITVDNAYTEEPHEVDFPPCAPFEIYSSEDMLASDADILHMPYTGRKKFRATMYQYFFGMVLECFASDCASLVVALLTPDMNGGYDEKVVIGGFMFSRGRCIAIGGEENGLMLEELQEHKRFGSNPIEISNMIVSSNFEASAIDAINSLSRAYSLMLAGVSALTSDKSTLDITAAVFPTFFYLFDGDLDDAWPFDDAPDIVCTPNGCALLPLDAPHSWSLPSIFEWVHGSTPLGLSSEAGYMCSTIALSRGAFDVLANGNFQSIEEEVSEFSTYIETVKEKYDVNDADLMLLDDYDAVITQRRRDKMLLDLYSASDDALKDEINSIVDVVKGHAGYIRKVVALEPIGELAKPNMDAEELMMNASLHAYLMNLASYDNDDGDGIKSMCMRCCYSSRPSTMFFAFEDTQGRLSKIAGVSWEKGRWRNIDKEHIDAIFAGSNLAQILEINPTATNIDYISFQHKSSAGDEDGD